jgi:hypothetical protein
VYFIISPFELFPLKNLGSGHPAAALAYPRQSAPRLEALTSGAGSESRKKRNQFLILYFSYFFNYHR